jgi:hypothetical protein
MIAKTFAPENGVRPFVIMKHRAGQPPGGSEYRITER